MELEMESTAEPQQAGAARPSQHGKPSKWDMKLQRWESHRDEIYEIYVVQNKTLPATMDTLKDKYQFTPCVRKFKDKIKEWKFEKYLSAEELKFIATKAKAREEKGKGTAFYKNGMIIDQKRIEKSAKRKREEFEEMQPHAAATPQQITYQTPLPNQNDLSDLPDVSGNADSSRSQGLEAPELITRPPSIGFTTLAFGDLHQPAGIFGSTNRNVEASSAGVEMCEGGTHSYELDLEADGGATSPFGIQDENKLTIYEELPDSETGKEATIEQARIPSDVDSGAPSLVELSPQRDGRFFVQFGALEESTASSSIKRFRNVVFTREMTDGVSGFETLKAVQKLGELLGGIGIFEEAELLFRRAIVGFEALGSDGFQLRLHGQFHLGKLLYRKQRYNEAQPLLVAAVAGYKSLHQDLFEMLALDCLLEVYIGGDSREQRAVTWRMTHLLIKQRGMATTNLSSALLEGIYLAKVYYRMNCSTIAESVLGRVVPQLRFLEDNVYGIEKLEGYLEYSCLCQQSRSWNKASEYLHLARELLNRASRCDAEAVQFVESRMKEVSLRSQGLCESPWAEEARRREALRQEALIQEELGQEGMRQLAETERALRQPRESDNRDEYQNDSYETRTGSYSDGSSRYGLTFPGSNSTGGDISEFLYP